MGEMEALMVKHAFHASGPLCWGPLQWMTLHQMARGFPRTNPSKEKQDAARAYVMALVDLLPCSICAMHWKDIAPTVNTESRAEFLRWTIDVHNAVNKRNGKKELSYEEALRVINETCTNNCLTIAHGVEPSNDYKTATVVLGVLVSVLAVLVIVILAVQLAKSRQA